MPAPNFVQAKKTTLSLPISDTEASEIKLKNLVDLYGNALTMSDIGSTGFITINPGGDNEEIVSFTGLTVNSDNTVSIDTGITRALVGVSPYGAGGTARNHAAGTVVVVSNSPQLYDAIIDYINSIAVAGASDADTTTKGITEVATDTEIDADTETGSTGAILGIDPSRLATSKYGTRLPTASQYNFINAVTGMVVPYIGAAAPTGFLLCDGSAVANDTYPSLAAVALGKFGLGTGTSFTADAGTDVFTANTHGLDDGDIVFVSNSGGAFPSGLSANTVYYVISSTTNTFQLSTSSGGAAVDVSDAGTGTHSFHTQFKVPDVRGTVVVGYGARTETFDFEDGDVNVGTDVITVDSNQWLYNGQAVDLTNSGGALPTGLSATTYYVIRVSATTIKLATSIAHANAGTAVNITAAAGGGTHTLTLSLTDRSLADEGGEENTQMSDDQLPSHAHSNAPGSGTAAGGGSSAYDNNGNTGAAGGDEAQNNMPPYTVLNYIVKT